MTPLTMTEEREREIRAHAHDATTPDRVALLAELDATRARLAPKLPAWWRWAPHPMSGRPSVTHGQFMAYLHECDQGGGYGFSISWRIGRSTGGKWFATAEEAQRACEAVWCAVQSAMGEG